MPNLANLPAADVQAGAKLWSGAGYIDGLQMQWVSATAVTVSSGRAYIPSLASYLDVPNAVALTGLVLMASTFYHLYLYDNAGTPAVECVTTAPDAPYSGTARAKTWDMSRRYIGSVLTDASGNIYNFLHNTNGRVFYQSSIANAPFKVNSSVLSSVTTIACSGIIPSTGMSALLNAINNDTTHAAWLGNSSIALSNTGDYLELIGTGSNGTTLATEIPIDSAQSFTAMQDVGATAALAIRVKGYNYGR